MRGVRVVCENHFFRAIHPVAFAVFRFARRLDRVLPNGHGQPRRMDHIRVHKAPVGRAAPDRNKPLRAANHDLSHPP